jgi:4-diphosphocytidyl-2-C-methyl-D-erythritol kinase
MRAARGAKAVRTARVRALAKINLDLRVLDKRADGYHELRTVFQTISLGDTLDISFSPARETSIRVTTGVEIAGRNLAERAAEDVLAAMGKTGRVEIRLTKRIPMGAGLGGGSSDAAAVLLALPVLAGRSLKLEALRSLAESLGSDVPFFLLGGTAVALGRGTELYPLEDGPKEYGLVVAPGVHVSTPDAYCDLDRARALTSEAVWHNINTFQSCVWERGRGSSIPVRNDFETVVFARYPWLKTLKRRLERSGADRALLSGSGSALYGLFRDREAAGRARQSFQKEQVFPIQVVSRAAYRALWWRQLGEHTVERIWPPQSQYA